MPGDLVELEAAASSSPAARVVFAPLVLGRILGQGCASSGYFFCGEAGEEAGGAGEEAGGALASVLRK